jgi:DnaJ-class molecular chaperone
VWALTVLGFDGDAVPAKRDVQRRFRDLLRDAHPDHGGETADAAQRIADLSEARDILIA